MSSAGTRLAMSRHMKPRGGRSLLRNSLRILTFSVCLFGCRSKQDASQRDVSVISIERRAVDAWLGCIECNSGELESIRQIASRKPEAIVDTLAAALFKGPSSAQIANLKEYLHWLHRRDSLYVRAHPDESLSQDSRAYVERFVGNFDATYRIRAALALAEIPTADARMMLDSAVMLDSATSGQYFRRDVSRALGRILGRPSYRRLPSTVR